MLVAWDHAGSVVGEKGRKKGWNRKNSGERSKLSGGEDYHLAGFTRRFFFFFFCQHRFFSPFPPMRSLGPDLEVGCIFKAPHLVLVQGMVFTQWYLTYFLLPLLINFLQAYLSGWGGDRGCVCMCTGWVGMMLCYYVRLEQQAFSNYSIAWAVFLRNLSKSIFKWYMVWILQSCFYYQLITTHWIF